MNRTLWLIGFPLALAGCATAPPCERAPDGAACRTERMLQQNDLMQVRFLLAAADPQGYPLAEALLQRSAALDQRGEVEFYQALLAIRRQLPLDAILPPLERAAAQRHPYAIALLYKLYQQPWLIERPDPLQAQRYRDAYGQLAVARSGYPSLEKALVVVSRLVEPLPHAQPVQPRD